MIDIKQSHGIWNGYDWYLVDHASSTETIFYAPTLKLALLLTRELGATISSTKKLPVGITNKLEEQKANSVYPIMDRPKAFHLAIGLTNNCTLACDYCHAEADRNTKISHKNLITSIENAFIGAAKTPKKTLSVSFAVGGEPTMNWKEFQFVVDRIRNLEKAKHKGVERVFLSMTTNCYYGEEKRKYVSRNFDTLTLSIDGDEQIQNLHRPTRAFNDSYALVSETCRYYIQSDNIRVGLRGTVSSESVNKLADIIEHYHNEFGGDYTVSFEPLIAIGRALTGALKPPSNEEFALNYWVAREKGKELGIRVITSAANIDRLVGRYCGAMSIPSFSVCTNGKITACHRDQDGSDYGYGEIDPESGEINIDHSRIKANVEKTEMPPYCEDCFAKWHCGGDCPDIRRIGYSRCDINRFILHKQLYELLTRGKEVI